MSERITPFFAQYALRTVDDMREIPRVSRTALEMIAADALEYGVADANGDEDIVWFPVDTTVGTAEDARLAAVNYANSDQFFRLVCRRVSEPWEVAG